MIRLFNTSHPSVYLSLLALSLVSRISLLFGSDTGMQEIDILDFSFKMPSVATWILESFVILICSILINYLMTYRQVVVMRSHLPAFGFIVFSSFGITGDSALSISLSALLTLLAFLNLAQLKTLSNPVSALFFGGLFIALSTALVPETAFLLIPALYILSEAKDGYGRSLFLLLVGFMTALYFLWTAYFLFDKGFVFIDTYLASFKFTIPNMLFEASGSVKLLLLVLFTVLGLLSSLASDAWKNVEPRRWQSMWLLMLATFSVLAIFSTIQTNLLAIIAMGLAAIISPFFLARKRKPIREFLFLVLIVLCLGFQLISSQLIVLT